MTRIGQATKLLLAVPAALAIASCCATEDTAAGTGGEAPTVTASIGGSGADTVDRLAPQRMLLDDHAPSDLFPQVMLKMGANKKRIV